MKNRLSDLNNHLFTQLERLCDEGIKGEKLTAEIERSRAISTIAKDILSTGRLALDGAKAVHAHGMPKAPRMLQDERD